MLLIRQTCFLALRLAPSLSFLAILPLSLLFFFLALFFLEPSRPTPLLIFLLPSVPTYGVVGGGSGGGLGGDDDGCG